MKTSKYRTLLADKDEGVFCVERCCELLLLLLLYLAYALLQCLLHSSATAW